MVAMTLSHRMARKLNDKVSVGAAVGLNYGFLSLTRNVGGNDEKQNDHDWATNYRLGLLMDLTDRTRAGITRPVRPIIISISMEKRVSQTCQMLSMTCRSPHKFVHHSR